jgi:hypothetical protein
LKPTGRTSQLLSCDRSVGGVVLADPPRVFAKMRSDKKRDQDHGSRFRACLLQSICQAFGNARASRVAKSIEAMTPELRRLCPLFADRTPEGDEQTRLGRMS